MAARAPARPGPQRKADTLAMLARPKPDTWVATASPTGVAHLVPLSFTWSEDRVLLAVTRGSPTAVNLFAAGRARLGFGHTRDVVLMDVVLDDSIAVATAPAALGDTYAGQADWDPRNSVGDYLYLALRPVRIQAWREANELDGRLLMQDGVWLV